MIEVTGRRGRSINSYWMTLGNEIILQIARGIARSPSVENWLWRMLLTCHNIDHRMNEWRLVYLCWNVLFCCMPCSQIRMLLFWMQTDKKCTLRWLVQRWVPYWKVPLCTAWRWPVIFADCIFIYVTCGSDNTQRTKKKLRKIWRRTSDWPETVVSCVLEPFCYSSKHAVGWCAIWKAPVTSIVRYTGSVDSDFPFLSVFLGECEAAVTYQDYQAL